MAIQRDRIMLKRRRKSVAFRMRVEVYEALHNLHEKVNAHSRRPVPMIEILEGLIQDADHGDVQEVLRKLSVLCK